MEFDKADTLTFGDAHIYFRMMIIEQLQIDLGMGARFFEYTDMSDTEVGISAEVCVFSAMKTQISAAPLQV